MNKKKKLYTYFHLIYNMWFSNTTFQSQNIWLTHVPYLTIYYNAIKYKQFWSQQVLISHSHIKLMLNSEAKRKALSCTWLTLKFLQCTINIGSRGESMQFIHRN